MGKGFDTFMENTYWRTIYEEAPGDHLKEYYRIMFDISPFVMGADYRDEEAESKLKELWISGEELEYLKKHAGTVQAKLFYQKCLTKLAEVNEKYVSAASLRGEVRNPFAKG